MTKFFPRKRIAAVGLPFTKLPLDDGHEKFSRDLYLMDHSEPVSISSPVEYDVHSMVIHTNGKDNYGAYAAIDEPVSNLELFGANGLKSTFPFEKLKHFNSFW
jgi:hypothetical protein